jgi:hypothetical protein
MECPSCHYESDNFIDIKIKVPINSEGYYEQQYEQADVFESDCCGKEMWTILHACPECRTVILG